MGGGPGAGAILIQSVLVMLIAIPTHLISYRYWRMHFIVCYLLTSLLIAIVALLFPLGEWMYFGGASAFFQPLGEWLWKNFILNLFIALLAGISLIGAYLREQK